MNYNNNDGFLSNDVREYLWQNFSNVQITPTINPKLFTCYDDYYCNSDTLANTGHILVGVIGLILSLMGLALNVLLIPVLSLVGIRSSATYYMIGIAISDCCSLIINVMLVVIRYLPSNSQVDQLHIYQSFVAYLVPFGVPLKMLCQTLSASLCACLMLDRFVYFKTEKKINTAKRAIAVKVMTTVVTLTIICKLPNFLVFKIVENAQLNIAVQWTLLAKSWIFIFDMMMFSVIYVVLVVFTFILWHVVITCHFMPKVFLVKLFEVHPKERFCRRERLYIMIGFMVGLFTVIFKLPQLLRNVFFGFSTNRDGTQMHKLAIAEMWMEAMDLLLIIIKPCIYILFVIHFRQALKDMIGLWIRPSRYTVLHSSGGLGKLIDVTSSNSDISRVDTSNSLLQTHNSENGYSRSLSKVDIDALAVQCVAESGKINNNIESNSSRMSVGSMNSVISMSNGDCVKF